LKLAAGQTQKLTLDGGRVIEASRPETGNPNLRSIHKAISSSSLILERALPIIQCDSLSAATAWKFLIFCWKKKLPAPCIEAEQSRSGGAIARSDQSMATHESRHRVMCLVEVLAAGRA
jgi:hypothetical protein